MTAAMNIPVDQMGRTLRRAFSSSTCLTVHGKPSGVESLPGLLIMHALFRNLKLNMGNKGKFRKWIFLTVENCV